MCVESLDELSDMASKLFSPIIRRGDDPLPMINDHPFGSAEKGVRISFESNSQTKTVCRHSYQ